MAASKCLAAAGTGGRLRACGAGGGDGGGGARGPEVPGGPGEPGGGPGRPRGLQGLQELHAHARWAWTIPVKNTFINFDVATGGLQLHGQARHRARSCPNSRSCSPMEHAAQELCHAMAPAWATGGQPGLTAAAAPAPATVRAPPAAAASPDAAAKLGQRSRRGPKQFQQQPASAPAPGRDPLATQREPKPPASPSTASTTAAIDRAGEAAAATAAHGEQRQRGATAAEADAGAGAVEPPSPCDAMSEVSTTSSERPIDKATVALLQDAQAHKWSSVQARKKGKGQSGPDVVGRTPPKLKNSPSSSSQGRSEQQQQQQQPQPQLPQQQHRPEVAPAPQSSSPHCQGKGEGKGRGLQHFRKMEVGIEDDPQFRVVQRLIGPRGKHMQDILNKGKGAKIWIIGRGSRSWEDDVGPLVVCVGAASAAAFETAVGLVTELLAKVAEDHRKFKLNR